MRYRGRTPMAGKGKLSGSTIEKVRAAKPAAAKLFAKSGALVGVGITRHGSGYALKINLSKSLKKPTDVPEQIEGVPVHVDVVGPIRKQSAS
jgi:hypothetical protein